MKKILIADQRASFTKSVASQISGKCIVKTCNDAKKALMHCRRLQPDLLVLDMEMPGMDGLRMIQAIQNSGLHMEILAITACTESEYVLRQFVQYGVQFILPKPCTVTAAVARIYEMLLMECGQNRNLEEDINSLVLSLGFRMDLGGYACLLEAIVQMMADSSRQLTKAIYPAVAEKYGGDGKRIERVIRSLIKDAWKRRDDAIWEMYFSPDRNGEIPCPTNGYFISRMAMCLNNRKIG